MKINTGPHVLNPNTVRKKELTGFPFTAVTVPITCRALFQFILTLYPGADAITYQCINDRS